MYVKHCFLYDEGRYVVTYGLWYVHCDWRCNVFISAINKLALKANAVH
jgi:hypothetical protein